MPRFVPATAESLSGAILAAVTSGVESVKSGGPLPPLTPFAGGVGDRNVGAEVLAWYRALAGTVLGNRGGSTVPSKGEVDEEIFVQP